MLVVVLAAGAWAAARPFSQGGDLQAKASRQHASKVGFAVRPAGSAVAGGKFPVSIIISNLSSRPISFVMLPTEVRMIFACHGPRSSRQRTAFKEVLQHEASLAHDDDDYCKRSATPGMREVIKDAIVNLPAGGALQREVVLDLAQVPPGSLSARFRFRILRAGADFNCDKPKFFRGDARLRENVIAVGPMSLFPKKPLLDGCLRGPDRHHKQQREIHEGEISGCVHCLVGGEGGGETK